MPESGTEKDDELRIVNDTTVYPMTNFVYETHGPCNVISLGFLDKQETSSHFCIECLRELIGKSLPSLKKQGKSFEMDRR